MNSEPVRATGIGVSSFEVLLDSRVYPLHTVLRSIHYMAPDWSGTVASQTADTLIVNMSATGGVAANASVARQMFLTALADFSLRERLEHETREIRELIVRQAFSSSNLQEPVFDSGSPISDPLGLGAPDPETGRSHG